ncbi:MAG: Gldg family protein [Lentisphaeria bacterium]|nr:Gldg family protein [Lentisphaeria bacterium]
MSAFFTCYKRELWKLLTTPLAATLLIFYLLLSGILTLTLGGFIDGNSASLDGFFLWQPWLFLFLGAAVTMGSWAEEYRTGTAEILLTLPVSPETLVWTKFFSALTLLATGLFCTAPFPVTCAWLGNPDWGPIATGYLGCLLTAGLFLALGQCASACASSQFVSFLTSFLLGLSALLAGFRPSNLLLLKWGAPPALMHFLSTSGLNSHFEELTSGRLALRDLYFFLAGTAVFLMLTCWRIRLRHCRRAPGRAALTLSLCVALVALMPMVDCVTWRLDYTSDGLYTMDLGSYEVLSEMKYPVEVSFVYSQNHPEISATTRRHALRVQELLREFAAHGQGNLRLREFFPETPLEQDEAEAMGLEPHIGSLGDLWFLGVAVRPLGQEGTAVTIPQLQPEEGASLEYQLVRTLAASQRSARRRLGVCSTLPVLESLNPMTKNLTPTWWILQQLEEDFELVDVDGQRALPEGLDALLLVHPKGFSATFWESVERHLNQGKGVFLALDPLSRAEAQRNGGSRILQASEVPADLAERWGIAFAKNRIVADRTLASAMTDSHRGLETLPTLLTLPKKLLSAGSPVTAHLASLSFFCCGSFQWHDKEGVSIVPLVSSTKDSRLLLPYEAQRNGADILTDFQADEADYALAVQVQEQAGGRAILVGDADWLHNSLCVNETQDAMGRERSIAINDNAAFLANAVEFLCDDSRLLRLRSRGVKPRTFTKLEALGKAAEKRIQELDAETYRENESLRSRGMALLQQGKSANDPEIQRQLDELAAEDARQQQRLKERQREVLFDLRKQLDALERNVALWNLLLMPALLALLASVVSWRRRH